MNDWNCCSKRAVVERGEFGGGDRHEQKGRAQMQDDHIFPPTSERDSSKASRLAIRRSMTAVYGLEELYKPGRSAISAHSHPLV